MMEAGIMGKQTLTVTDELTAGRIGSGTLAVYATPQMVAFMENTALKSVEPYLEEGQGTVGTSVNISHVAATPVGMQVTCETRLVSVEKRKLTFEVKCFDEAGLIGEGTHERFIIDNEKFMSKANGKLQH